MTTADSRSSTDHFDLPRSDAILDDESPTDGGTKSDYGTLKSEDSGIVANGLQSPDEEVKEIVTDGSSSVAAAGKKSNKNKKHSTNSPGGDGVTGRTGSRRRSSTETYSSTDDDVDEEVANDETSAKRRRRQKDGDPTGGGAWLSEDDDTDAAAKEKLRHETDGETGCVNGLDSVPTAVEMDSGGEGDDRPSVGSSPVPDEKKQPPPPRIEEPRVDFIKGIRCTDAIKAVEILKTRYRLADIEQRDYHHRQWSSWGPTDYNTRSYIRNRSHYDQYDAPEGSKQLKEVCIAIERRHREIEEILRKLLELDEANRAEAEALSRLASAGDARLSSPGAHGTGSATNQSGTDAGRSLMSESGSGRGTTANGDTNGSRPLKRRNPFRRAVTAIRKRFSRSEQPVPVAA